MTPDKHAHTWTCVLSHTNIHKHLHTQVMPCCSISPLLWHGTSPVLPQFSTLEEAWHPVSGQNMERNVQKNRKAKKELKNRLNVQPVAWINAECVMNCIAFCRYYKCEIWVHHNELQNHSKDFYTPGGYFLCDEFTPQYIFLNCGFNHEYFHTERECYAVKKRIFFFRNRVVFSEFSPIISELD